MAKKLLIKNIGLVHTMSKSGSLKDVSILIEDGVIKEIDKDVKPGTSSAEILNAEGLTALPGLIDACTHMGIYVLEREVGDHGVEKSDPITPHLRVIDSLDPYDPAFKNALKGGVTTVAVHPGSYMSFGRLVDSITIMPGQTAILKVNGEVLMKEHAIIIAVGEHVKRFLEENKMVPTTRMGMLASIRAHLFKAKDYLQRRDKGDAPIDLKLEALAKLLRGELTALIHAYTTRDMLSLINILQEFEISKIAVVHGIESFKVADVLSERGIPVILGPIVFSKRGVELKEVDSRIPVYLYKSNVKFALTTDHPTLPIEYLSLLASVAVGEGLPAHEALRSITINAAEILGIADRIGSVEPGKDADLVLFEGDPLDPSSKVAYTIVNGNILYER
ncbi:MAG: amidohydrolase family protein [Thermoprotei archaeon]|nr:amidohydrolase family protein [Thermoprotei archaeon]